MWDGSALGRTWGALWPRASVVLLVAALDVIHVVKAMR